MVMNMCPILQASFDTQKAFFKRNLFIPRHPCFSKRLELFLEKRKLRVKKVGFVFFALLPNAYGTKLVFFRCSILVGNFYWKMHFDGMHYENTESKIRIVVVVQFVYLPCTNYLGTYTLHTQVSICTQKSINCTSDMCIICSEYLYIL